MTWWIDVTIRTQERPCGVCIRAANAVVDAAGARKIEAIERFLTSLPPGRTTSTLAVPWKTALRSSSYGRIPRPEGLPVGCGLARPSLGPSPWRMLGWGNRLGGPEGVDRRSRDMPRCSQRPSSSSALGPAIERPTKAVAYAGS